MSKEFFEKFRIDNNDAPIKGVEQQPNKIKVRKVITKIELPELPGEAIGIEETKDVVTAGVSLANAIIASLQDGKVTLADLPKFVGALTKIPSALSGIGKVPAELADMNEEEAATIIALVKEELEVDDDKAKIIAGKAIGLMYDLYDFVKTIKN